MKATCEFEQVNELEVRCIHCGRELSGTPERYKDKVICKERLSGPGTDLENIFKWWAKKLSVSYKPCSKCKSMRRDMDIRGKDWVRNNLKGIAAQVQRNAKAQGFTLPIRVVEHWLRKVSKP